MALTYATEAQKVFTCACCPCKQESPEVAESPVGHHEQAPREEDYGLQLLGPVVQEGPEQSKVVSRC